MTIFNSAYHTTATNGYATTKLVQALEQIYYNNSAFALRENIQAVRDGTVSNGVPVFNFPVVVPTKDNDLVFIDIRSIIAAQPSGSFRIRDETEMTTRIINAQLALDWHQGYQGRIRDISPLGLVVYAHWLGEIIAKRFALDGRQQLQASALAGIFYLNNFWDKSEASSEDKAYLLSAITRICGYKHTDVVDLVEAHPIIRDVAELCEAIKTFTASVRLEDFNPSTLFATVAGSWYGNAGRESIQVALEYPPTWLTILFQAITNRGFKKAGLTQIVERNSYKKYHQGFVTSLAYLGQQTENTDY